MRSVTIESNSCEITSVAMLGDEIESEDARDKAPKSKKENENDLRTTETKRH